MFVANRGDAFDFFRGAYIFKYVMLHVSHRKSWVKWTNHVVSLGAWLGELAECRMIKDYTDSSPEMKAI